MILGIDPLYLILIMIAAVAIGLGAFGFVMYRMLGKLTIVADKLTAIHALVTRPVDHPALTRQVMLQIEQHLEELRLAGKEQSPTIVAQLVEAANTLQQITAPLKSGDAEVGWSAKHSGQA